MTDFTSPMPSWLKMLDHTADAGLIVRAPDLKTLFARAAWGMFAIITDPDKVHCLQKVGVEVEAADRAALLVRWLSELNFQHVTQHQIFGRFEILDLTDTQLVAEAYGEPIDSERHTVYTEIKAVTFHGLEIRETADGWRAQMIFDL